MTAFTNVHSSKDDHLDLISYGDRTTLRHTKYDLLNDGASINSIRLSDEMLRKLADAIDKKLRDSKITAVDVRRAYERFRMKHNVSPQSQTIYFNPGTWIEICSTMTFHAGIYPVYYGGANMRLFDIEVKLDATVDPGIMVFKENTGFERLKRTEVTTGYNHMHRAFICDREWIMNTIAVFDLKKK